MSDEIKKAMFDSAWERGYQVKLVVSLPCLEGVEHGIADRILGMFVDGQAITLNYDPDWPMHAEITEHGISAKMSFGTSVCPVFVPWSAVMVVQATFIPTLPEWSKAMPSPGLTVVR